MSERLHGDATWSYSRTSSPIKSGRASALSWSGRGATKLTFRGGRGNQSELESIHDPSAPACLCPFPCRANFWCSMGSTEQRLTEQADRHPPGSGAADLALIRRVQQGDRSAFDLLVVKYQHKIVKLIMRYVRDSSEALDVAQEAFLKAYRAAPSFRGDSAFYTWLYRIAINTAKNHLVANARKPVSYDLDTQDPEQAGIMNELRELDTPEALVQSEEIRDTINRAIHALPEELRTAILLREIEGLSYEEIAQTMECPVGTVRSRIFRAREAIDKALAPLL
jgi:RNA polymerase sigma-70 factor, ECF subfamily